MNASSGPRKINTDSTTSGQPPGLVAAAVTPATNDPLVIRFLAAFSPKRNAWRTSELKDAGFDDRAVHRLVAAGQVRRIRLGTYVRGSYWDSLSRSAQDRVVISLHAIGTGSKSPRRFVYSHVSAARIHRLSLWQADTFVHVTQGSTPSSTACDSNTRIHVATMPSSDIVEIDGKKVTSLERTVVDCCLTMNYKQALILTDHALRIGASMDKLREAASNLSCHRGVRTLRKVLDNADGRSESPGETLTRDLLRELFIEAPELQYWINTRQGPYRADFAWVAQRVALEFDGRTKYFDYRPTNETIFMERKREIALVEAGWIVLRLEWKDLFDGLALKARILIALNHLS
ncbi:type IV toxin-antitoxin system AbiEi family antitoxin domain-containing protein [Arthrobacter psychrolactophilus]|uniref:type IV toxin-antitoxin system AbiEi family antitoxin domain-containing protein n=1 Tax=Arthrobacter psychrolactophilus TaxID=92442 RepID=UPI001FE86983|nr:type IV toxin-antitoxin system AbiEi family antitoxin domain-containing protein [Arthrobacter psychrolactophilus]